VGRGGASWGPWGNRHAVLPSKCKAQGLPWVVALVLFLYFVLLLPFVLLLLFSRPLFGFGSMPAREQDGGDDKLVWG
jgi:hypothetical protein